MYLRDHEKRYEPPVQRAVRLGAPVPRQVRRLPAEMPASEDGAQRRPPRPRSGPQGRRPVRVALGQAAVAAVLSSRPMAVSTDGSTR